MLTLKIPGQSFSMEIVGYEFPDEELGPTEDNPADEFQTGRFLNIAVEASRSDQTWQAVRPEMTTTELARMVDWLQTIADGTCSKSGVYFTERDLEFAVDPELKTLRVLLFFSDLLPPGAGGDTFLHLDFPILPAVLAENIHSLRNDLQRLPGRPPLGRPA